MIKNKKPMLEKEPRLPEVLNKRFNKIHDPNYSLFENEYRTYRYMNIIFLIFVLGGLPLFILGLTLLILGNIFGVIPLTFGGLSVMMIMMLPLLITNRLKFKTVLELKEQKQFTKLLELARKYSISNSFLDQERARLATYLLVDNKSYDIALLLKERLSQQKPINVRDLLRTFYLLALKLGYQDHKALFLALESGRKPVERVPMSAPAEDKEVVVPITKVYFLDHIPENARCMVSGLQLDFKQDKIVVCPYCSAWAQKELLEKWLKDKKTCPVCRRELKIDDCPDVQLTYR